MPEEKVDIVNERDEVVGVATRKEAHRDFLLHRVADVWFYNDKNEVLLQERSSTKDSFPGTYGLSAGGHLSSGQSVEEGIVREIKEETGLDVAFSDLQFLEKKIIQKLPLRHFGHYFAYKYGGNIQNLHFDPVEVDGFKWVSIFDIYNPELKLYSKVHPFVISKKHISIFLKLAQLMDARLDEEQVRRNAKDLV